MWIQWDNLEWTEEGWRKIMEGKEVKAIYAAAGLTFLSHFNQESWLNSPLVRPLSCPSCYHVGPLSCSSDCCAWTLTSLLGSALRGISLFCLNFWSFDPQSGVMAIRSSSRGTPVWLQAASKSLRAAELFLFNSLVFPKGRCGNGKGSLWGQRGLYQHK